MASPTRWFRKNSKVLVVVLAVFAMAIFGLGDTFFQRGGPTEGSDFRNEVVALWGNNQKITRADLAVMLERHFQVQRFLEAVEREAQLIKKDEFRPMAQRIAPIQGDERTNRSAIDEQLIERFIMARKAEKEGLLYTDAMLDDYLNLLSGQVGFSNAQLTQLNRDANTTRVSFEVVRRHLRQELLAQQMRMFANAGYQEVPNVSEAAELYRRATEMVECEVLPVDVEQFVSVPENPSSAELRRLYEEGKYDYPDPTFERPGFKRPDRAALQYIMADRETFLQNEMNKLTDEQVQLEYERLVAEKNDLVMEVVPQDQNLQEPSDPSGQTEGQQPEVGAPGVTGDGEIPNSQETPVPIPQATETPNSETPAAETPATENPTSENPPSEPSNSEPDSPNGEPDDSGMDLPFRNSDQLNTDSDSYFKLVSLVQDAEPNQDEPTGNQDEPPSNPEEPRQGDAPGSEPTTEPAQAPSQPSAQENAQPPMSQESSGATDPNAVPATDSQSQTQPQDPASAPQDQQPLSGLDSLFAEDRPVEKRPKPLTSVADAVKRNMVREKVEAEMERVLKKVEEELDYHQTDLMAWDANPPETRGSQPVFDYQALASRLGLIHGETEMLDFRALSETAIGRAIGPVNVGQQTMWASIAQRVFGDFDRSNKFVAERHSDFIGGNSYVYWIKDKQGAAVVSFEEVKDEVEKFWKRKRMIETALAKAQSLADEANTKKQPLAELFGENVSQTGQFSWHSTLSQTNFGQPVGVKNPGNDFMKAVFALKQDEVGTAVNADRSIVYVVRMMSERRGIESIGTDFVERQFLPKKTVPRDVLQLSMRYAQEYHMDWTQELFDEMGLKFLGR
jgi:hypothetical protein